MSALSSKVSVLSMGLEYFAQQCSRGEVSEKAALIWCVAKEGTCCGICSNTLASVGSRVGLTFAVFFSSLVIVVDGAESPFLFLTTSVQALAYLVVVLWEGFSGGGISRFHSYYALFSSFGWISPIAAASLTATHYGYGGTHQRSGVRLISYRTDLARRIQASKESPLIEKSLSHRPEKSKPFFLFRSLGRSPYFSSVSRGGIRSHETRPLVNDEPTTSDFSPILHPERETPEVPIMSRRRSQRIPRVRQQPIPPESPQRPPPPIPQTPSTFLGLPPALLQDDCDRHQHGESRTYGRLQQPLPLDNSDSRSIRVANNEDSRSIRVSDNDDSTSTTRQIDIEKPPSVAEPSDLEAGSTRLRRRQPNSSSRPTSRSNSPVQNRASTETKYTPAQLNKIRKRVRVFGSGWRRYGYPIAVVILSILWLVALLAIEGYISSFKLAQTNCVDPKGTRILQVGSITFLVLAPVVTIIFVLNYHVQWLPQHLRRIFDYNRDGSHFTRFLLPAIFSGLVFALWQTLLWTSYQLAAEPDSSLLAATEQSATFASVLSLALCIKPLTDLAKAFMKIHKRKRRELKETRRVTNATPRPTPTVLPRSSTPERLELPPFEPLTSPAIRISRASSKDIETGLREPNNRSIRRYSRRSSHRRDLSPVQHQETFDSVPDSQRSSIATDSDEGGEEEGNHRKPSNSPVRSWIRQASRSPGRRR